MRGSCAATALTNTLAPGTIRRFPRSGVSWSSSRYRADRPLFEFQPIIDRVEILFLAIEVGNRQRIVGKPAGREVHGKHAVFGVVESDDDMAVVNAIVQGDALNTVSIEGDASGLLEKCADKITVWNEMLG